MTKQLTALEVLECVDALLDTPKKWIKGTFAVDKRGIPTRGFSSDAERFCMLGAIEHCLLVPTRGDDPASTALKDALVSLNYWRSNDPVHVASFNDRGNTTFKMAKKVIAKAIEIAKKTNG